MMCQVSPLDKSHDLPGNHQQQQQSSGLPTTQATNNNNNNNGLNHGKSSRRPTYAEIVENPLVDDRIRPMQFDFDALGILPKCQQAELLFSMFADGQELLYIFFFCFVLEILFL